MPRFCVDQPCWRRASPAACGGAGQFGSQNLRVHSLADASASTICVSREGTAGDGAALVDARMARGKAPAFVAEFFYRDAGMAGAQRVSAQAQRRDSVSDTDAGFRSGPISDNTPGDHREIGSKDDSRMAN